MRRVFFLIYIFIVFFVFAEKNLSFPEKIGHIPHAMLDLIKMREEEFLKDLQDVLKDDMHDLFILVDKEHHLSKSYVPYGLARLKSCSAYVINKDGLKLTSQTEKALFDMGMAAKKDGISLVVSSTYRTYEYQKALFARYTKQYGEKEAERFSARAGTTQHQLGTAIDFGSITTEYAKTKAGIWLAHNAGDYGFSLSFPQNYEHVTGYIWECWHYRYLGRKACNFQKKYFDDIQQYMLEFIDWWKT